LGRVARLIRAEILLGETGCPKRGSLVLKNTAVANNDSGAVRHDGELRGSHDLQTPEGRYRREL
jgi:hypothetical protein